MKISKKIAAQLKKLQDESNRLSKLQDDLFIKAAKITKEKDRTFDFIFNNHPESLDNFLDDLKIKIK
jgi:hypothetical protein